jgi:hypothetical protein
MKHAILICGFLSALGANAQAQSGGSTGGQLGKCENLFSSDCENLYGTYSAMDVSKLEQKFMAQDTSMTFDEMSILQKGYSENRIHGMVSRNTGSASSGAGEALVTFARSCSLNNQFKTYGQFLNLIKTPVYGQADCLASQTQTIKDKVIEAAQAAQVGM